MVQKSESATCQDPKSHTKIKLSRSKACLRSHLWWKKLYRSMVIVFICKEVVLLGGAMWIGNGMPP